jgi:membrane protein involved in colicin uptake
MKRNFWLRKLPLAVLVCGMVVTAAAWQDHSATNTRNIADTTPNKHREKKIRDIDDAIAELERGEQELHRSLKEMDFSKIEKQIRESIESSQVDAAKIRADIEKAMKDIDVTKMRAEMDKAMKELDAAKMKMDKAEFKDIDVAKVKAEIEKAMKEVDIAKIKAETDMALAKVDMEKLQKEINESRKLDLDKMKEEMKELKPTIEKSLKEAHEGIEKAKAELKAYKGFIDGLDKDGLINKKGEYTIEHENGELTINGKKQSQEVYNRYRGFLEKQKNFTIKKSSDDFDLDID